MALFNKINRRIKSMQEGGQPFSGGVVMPEVDDGSIGGFNRPELRGLRKQARRGTLTNRERRRLNYLTNEVKGRRRRGLLSGLGGAAAALGTAALIKSGGAKGLMDSIKGKIGSIKSDLEAKKANKEFRNMLEEDMKKEFGIGEKKDDPPINIDDIEIDEGPELDEGEEVIEGEKSGEELGAEAAAMRQLMAEEREREKQAAIEKATAAGSYKRVGPPRGGSSAEEEFAPDATSEDMLKALQNAEGPEETKRILDKMGAVRGGGGGMTLEEIQKDKQLRQELEQGGGAPSAPQSVIPENPGQGEEVDTSMSTMGMLDALQRGVDPEVLGAVRGAGGQDLASKIDPEGLVKGPEGGNREEGALTILKAINSERERQGFPPVSQITEEMMRQWEAGEGHPLSVTVQGDGAGGAGGGGGVDITMPDGSDAPPGASLSRSTAEKQMKPGQVIRGYRTKDGQIVYYPADSGKMNVGGMVKRMIQRYN